MMTTYKTENLRLTQLLIKKIIIMLLQFQIQFLVGIPEDKLNLDLGKLHSKLSFLSFISYHIVVLGYSLFCVYKLTSCNYVSQFILLMYKICRLCC